MQSHLLHVTFKVLMATLELHKGVLYARKVINKQLVGLHLVLYSVPVVQGYPSWTNSMQIRCMAAIN
jgi:hypothetical protein